MCDGSSLSYYFTLSLLYSTWTSLGGACPEAWTRRTRKFLESFARLPALPIQLRTMVYTVSRDNSNVKYCTVPYGNQFTTPFDEGEMVPAYSYYSLVALLSECRDSCTAVTGLTSGSASEAAPSSQSQRMLLLLSIAPTDSVVTRSQGGPGSTTAAVMPPPSVH